MISQIVLNFVASLLATIVGWIPPLPESWSTGFANGLGWLGTLANNVASLGVIMNWPAFAAAAGIYVGAIALFIAIWGMKFVLSLVSGGGGN